jgi:hypothetical protein
MTRAGARGSNPDVERISPKNAQAHATRRELLAAIRVFSANRGECADRDKRSNQL